MEEIENWVSMDTICKHLDCSRDTVKKMIKTKKLPAYKMGRQWKFKITEVDAWLANEYKSAEEGKEG